MNIKGSRTLTRKQVAYAIEQQKLGVPQTKLATELGCSQNSISRAVKGHVPMHPRRKRHPRMFRVRARLLRREGHSYERIAKMLGVGPTSVKRWISEKGES